MPAKTKLAQLIARQEGYGIPGAIPTMRNNPGDLRHSPHSTHPPGNPDCVGYIDTIDHGWEDLECQLLLYARRGMTLAQMIAVFAPPNENNTNEYLDFVCGALALEPSDLVTVALLIPASSPSEPVS